MNALVDKAQVEKQFSRAANSYNSAASVQKQMSDQLIQTLSLLFKNKPILSITDLGCGTGLSLQELSKQHPNAEINAVDISSLMLSHVKELLPQARLICADMEKYHCPTPQDLIFSNASIQWCDLKKVLKQVRSSLNTGAIFAFSSFGPKTHYELAKAWQQTDGREHRIDFLSAHEHAQILHASNFSILEQRSDTRTLTFEGTKELLDSIKKTGATNAATTRQRGLLSRKRYRNFLTELEKTQPLTLSYETLSFVAKKVET